MPREFFMPPSSSRLLGGDRRALVTEVKAGGWKPKRDPDLQGAVRATSYPLVPKLQDLHCRKLAIVLRLRKPL